MGPQPQAGKKRSKPPDSSIRAAKIGGMYTIAAAIIGALLAGAFTNGFGLFATTRTPTPTTSPSPSSADVVILSLTSPPGRVVASGNYTNVEPADQIYLVATFPDHKPLLSDAATKSAPGTSSGDWNVNSSIGPFPAPPTWRWAIWQCSVPGPQCTVIALRQLALQGLRASGIVASRVYQGALQPGSSASTAESPG